MSSRLLNLPAEFGGWRGVVFFGSSADGAALPGVCVMKGEPVLERMEIFGVHEARIYRAFR
jgi:hypothetical protein